MKFKKKIPKIIHQIWIGEKNCPINLMNTWKEKNPDFEYIFWNEEEIKKRELNLECISEINDIEEINGKADIIRWEILYKYGGLFVDADSICIEPIDFLIDKNKAFCSYENEKLRPGLIATGTMAFPKNHCLLKKAISYIKNNKISRKDTGKMAWETVGPVLLTKLIQNNKFNDIEIFPSYYFLPEHYSQKTVENYCHSKIYAYQFWGSAKQNYDTMNYISLPDEFKKPKLNVSVLVSSYNTNHKYIKECLESIKNQKGHFGIELVWINDGSDEENTKLLEKSLDEFKQTTRFIDIIYKKLEKNRGISYCLNKGVNLCNNELIMKFDSDDICKPDRMIKQINFMLNNKDCNICGTNIELFKEINNKKIKQGQTNHKFLLTLEEYKNSNSHWFANHPTLCFKKSCILEVGNYNINNKSLCEDFELELKLLKKYGKIYNIQENLVQYRIHDEQVTANNSTNQKKNINYRNKLIQQIIY